MIHTANLPRGGPGEGWWNKGNLSGVGGNWAERRNGCLPLGPAPRHFSRVEGKAGGGLVTNWLQCGTHTQSVCLCLSLSHTHIHTQTHKRAHAQKDKESGRREREGCPLGPRHSSWVVGKARGRPVYKLASHTHTHTHTRTNARTEREMSILTSYIIFSMLC